MIFLSCLRKDWKDYIFQNTIDWKIFDAQLREFLRNKRENTGVKHQDEEKSGKLF